MAEKARYWVGVLYNENMRPDWQESIGDILQLPYAYCIHDKDKISESCGKRIIHTHVIIAYNNTTTYKTALRVFEKLSADGAKAINKCEPINNIMHMYNYLIHDTEDCRKKKKHLYDALERVCGNNFDIGSYVQMSEAEKADLLFMLCNMIQENHITNFADFYDLVFSSGYNLETFNVVKTNNGFLERLCKGQYLKICASSLGTTTKEEVTCDGRKEE